MLRLNRLLFIVVVAVSGSAFAGQDESLLGDPISLDELKISISPPKGWKTHSNYMGKALVMEEAKTERSYKKPTYVRNISLAVSHEPQPIDEQTVGKLRQELTKSFSKYGQDFSLSESYEIFDFTEQSKGILIYSFLTLGEVPMTQLHFFVSGSEQSVLLTYTDLSERFEENRPTFQVAWHSLMSLQIPGTAPDRYGFILVYLSGALVVFLILALASRLRHRKMSKIYESAEDLLFFGEEEDQLDDEDFQSMVPQSHLSKHPTATFI